MSAPTPPAGQELPFLRAVIMTVITDVLSSAVTFGLPLTADQTTAVLVAVNSLSALVFFVLSLRAHNRSTPLSNPVTVIAGPDGPVTVPLVPAYNPNASRG